MLQQTTVEAVIPYYQRFIERYPTLKDLAQAEEESVITLWAGLGYYSRARNLLKAARQINKDIPQTAQELSDLPGIGPYTSAAIASIAFDEPVACIDGNVMRVLSRLYCYEGDVGLTQSKKDFQRLGNELVHPKYPGDFNQAMMELGATICTPTNPKCSECPVKNHCEAKKSDTQINFPIKTKKIKYIDQEFDAWIISHDHHYLLRKRNASERNPGMWEFPLITADQTQERLSRQTNISEDETRKPNKSIRHTITHHRMNIWPFFVPLDDRSTIGFKKNEVEWIHQKLFLELPLTTISKKIIRRHPEAFFR